MGNGNESSRNEPVEAKIFVARDERTSKQSNWIPTVLSFLGAIVGAASVVGASLFTFNASLAEQRNQRAIANDQLTQELEKQMREFKKQADELKRELIVNFELPDGYEAQRSLIFRIGLTSIEEAVNLERSQRTGATIRALEDLFYEAGGNSNEESLLVRSALSGVPKILFVDSPIEDNIYCQDSVNSSRTNVDDIVFSIRQLPIRIAGIVTQPDRIEASFDRIRNFIDNYEVSLVVIHADAFQVVGGASVSSLKYLSDLVRHHIGGKRPNIGFIVYSRSYVEFKDLAQEVRDSNNYFSFVQLSPHDKRTDGDCFSIPNNSNITKLRQEIEIAVGLNGLFSQDFFP